LHKNTSIWIILLSLIIPPNLYSLENQDVVSHIGYPFTSIETGKLEMDYRLDVAIDEYDSISGNYQIIQERLYNISNTFFLSYDVSRPFSLNLSIPIVYARRDIERERSANNFGIGDISIGSKIQLYCSQHTALCFNINYVAATGESPYEKNPEIEIATGNGYDSIQTKVTMAKMLHPVFPFMSLHYNKNFPVKNLNNFRYGKELDEVRPADTTGSNLGVGFAASEKISFLFELFYQYHFGGEYIYTTGAVPVMDCAEAGINLGFGWKISEKAAIYLGLSKGLSEDGSDYQFSLRIPFIF
jgi:hypothetical protein